MFCCSKKKRERQNSIYERSPDIATSFSDAQLSKLDEKFKLISKNKPHIDRADFKENWVILELNYADHLADRLFDSIDLDHSGQINFTEFIRYLDKLFNGNDDQKAELSFRFIDVKNKGFFNKKDLQDSIESIKLVSNGHTQKDQLTGKQAEGIANYMFQEFDVKKKGIVTYDDFKEVLSKTPEILSFFDGINSGLAEKIAVYSQNSTIRSHFDRLSHLDMELEKLKRRAEKSRLETPFAFGSPIKIKSREDLLKNSIVSSGVMPESSPTNKKGSSSAKDNKHPASAGTNESEHVNRANMITLSERFYFGSAFMKKNESEKHLMENIQKMLKKNNNQEEHLEEESMISFLSFEEEGLESSGKAENSKNEKKPNAILRQFSEEVKEEFIEEEKVSPKGNEKVRNFFTNKKEESLQEDFEENNQRRIEGNGLRMGNWNKDPNESEIKEENPFDLADMKEPSKSSVFQGTMRIDIPEIKEKKVGFESNGNPKNKFWVSGKPVERTKMRNSKVEPILMEGQDRPETEINMNGVIMSLDSERHFKRAQNETHKISFLSPKSESPGLSKFKNGRRKANEREKKKEFELDDFIQGVQKIQKYLKETKEAFRDNILKKA